MEKFDAVVIGAGHAGCEAALALARTKQKTLLLTISLDAVAFLACNPSIGGTAKGHIVCEVDALGGQMGINTDRTLLQKRMLNEGKGPAVQSLRAQVDKQFYHEEMKRVIEETPNLRLKQAQVVDISIDKDKKIIKTAVGEEFECKAIVIATGVYLRSNIIIGDYIQDSGPNGYMNSKLLSGALERLGLKLSRFKTGTPARINGRTIDFSKLEAQYGDNDIQNFSFTTENAAKNVSACYLTYTNKNTHKIIMDSLDRAPTYNGVIKGTGTRYCPSIETKVVRFKDKDRHQAFLEPESARSNEYYVQGISTSLPVDVQKEMYSSIEGLENAEIMRDAYAIEYDAIDSTELKPNLEHKKLSGIFFAGQINGTSGYEEAAGQGIIAGINASLYLRKKAPLILKRNEAYIGVLIDDLVTKGTPEPYRMMTSRAEYRLFLRQDNADIRLTEKGRSAGLVDDDRWKKFTEKIEKIQKVREKLKEKLKNDEKLQILFKKHKESIPQTSISILEAVKRNNINLKILNNEYNFFDVESDVLEHINTEIKYEGYLKQQEEEIKRALRNEGLEIPENFVYSGLKNLREETILKLEKIRPINIGQASRISGISPADIAVLSIYVKKYKGS